MRLLFLWELIELRMRMSGSQHRKPARTKIFSYGSKIIWKWSKISPTQFKKCEDALEFPECATFSFKIGLLLFFGLHVANILVLGNWASCGGDRRLKWAQSKTNSTWTTIKRVKDIIHYDMPATNRAFSLLGITLRSFRRLLLPANLKNDRYLQRFFHLSRGTWSEFDSIFSGMGLKSYQNNFDSLCFWLRIGFCF